MNASYDHDIVIVGGGPAGCSAGVFTAREGRDTVIFDRGRSSIQRCAHLENYLGFPRGVDIETFYTLIQDHAETAGCTIVPDLVESVDRLAAAADSDDTPDGFAITPQEGETVTARRVIAATRYDGEYMRGLDSDAAMFRTDEHDGDEHEQFDPDYAEADGSTPVDGLYVATPAGKPDKQAILAAGRGARVAKRVIADAHIDDGWWQDAAEDVDWVRQAAELDAEWEDRDSWIEWFDDHYAEAAPVAPDSDRFKRVRAASIDDSLSSYITDEEIDDRATAGHEAVAARLDPEAIVAAVDSEQLLAAIDDDAIRTYRERQPQFERGAQ